MPSPDVIRSTIADYLARFSAGDREGWLDLFAEGATVEDPVGSPVRTGRDEIGAFFDESTGLADSIELRPGGEPIVLGNEAAFPFFACPTLGGTAMRLPAIDLMTFDEEGRITSQRAFVDHAMLGPDD